MRRAKVICTIGPSSRSPEMLEKMIGAGMNVARLNFSHGAYPEHAEVIGHLRARSDRLAPVSILQDLQGPKIRCGIIKSGSTALVKGAQTTITTRSIEGTAERFSTTYEALPRDVKRGDHILIDDGLIELRVLDTTDADVRCEVVEGGELKSNKGINLPNVSVSAPALTAKDREDLQFGIAQRVDYVALSFVRCPEDVLEAKRIIADAGADIPVIAKLEKPEALHCLDGIIQVSDGVMVARGDLGVELPPEQVPVLQKRIVREANEARKPVIIATQMLESMTNEPRPTRAEASDVANAILDGTNAVMLSGETAVGKYPVETVEMMSRIVQHTEEVLRARWRLRERDFRLQAHFPEAICQAAAVAAVELGVRALVGFTHSGNTARLLAAFRPTVPIIVFTPHETVYRRLSLFWGVTPQRLRPVSNTDELIREVDRALLAGGFAAPGDVIVLACSAPVAVGGSTNWLMLHHVGMMQS
jgi:pyruvate kinase